MSEVRVIQINESVFAENGREAELIRSRLTAQGTLFLNFMSSPGSGKTTTLVALINRLKGSLNIGEMDVDIESSLDAQRVADRTGIRSLQIHNGGLCHIDADMTARALAEYDTEGLDLLILENISDVVLINKIDAMDYFDFSIDKARERILALNPRALLFPISAKTGEGLDAVCDWIFSELKALRS